jgi:type II secretory pathway pseudopilin PulG
MRILLAVFALLVAASITRAQDPGMQAAQQTVTQMDTQMAQQAMQQAQQATIQQSLQQSAQSTFSSPGCCIVAARPKFSVKSGTYDSPQKVKITDSARGSIIYYTTDGWTPTAASNRYLGPITVRTSTLLQTVAIAPSYDGRSLVVSAQYNIATLPGASLETDPADDFN